MPQIFKALASVGAWFLFIVGWLLLAVPLFMGFAVGMDIEGGPPEWVITFYQTSVVTIILSVVAMRLRQKME